MERIICRIQQLPLTELDAPQPVPAHDSRALSVPLPTTGTRRLGGPGKPAVGLPGVVDFLESSANLPFLLQLLCPCHPERQFAPMRAFALGELESKDPCEFSETAFHNRKPRQFFAGDVSPRLAME